MDSIKEYINGLLIPIISYNALTGVLTVIILGVGLLLSFAVIWTIFEHYYEKIKNYLEEE